MDCKNAVIELRSLALRATLFIAVFLLAMQGASAQSYYGSKWAADGLANTVIGAGHNQGDYRFRSTHTGTLAAIHTYWQNGSGYGSGNGGTYRIDLETDDGTSNHFASGKVLATTNELHPNNLFVTETFSSPATITSGTLYHIVYTNIDSSPTVNYTSLDMIWVAGGTKAPTPSQPTVSDIDWAHLYNSGSASSPSWHWRHGSNGDDGDYMPTLELVYGDGTITGTGYMEVWIETSRKNVSGSNQARETFTVSGGDKVATTFSIRMRKDSGADPLTVTLKTASGTTIESGTIPAGSFSTTDAWATYTFASARTLANGNSYNIILSTPGSSSYSLFPIREGISYNFQAPTFFADGHAQLSTSSGSSWADWPDESGNASAQGDLQFYFATGQQAAASSPMPPTELVITTVN
jgi:hypothetical protein